MHRAPSQKKGHFAFINFTARLECKIHFAARLECKIHFAAPLECKIHFAAVWSAKFILQPAFSKCYFAFCQEMAFFWEYALPNLLVAHLNSFLLSGFQARLIMSSQNKFCTPKVRQNKFCTPKAPQN